MYQIFDLNCEDGIIGVWDPANDIFQQDKEYKFVHVPKIKSEANKGNLFFINTKMGLYCKCAIFINDTIPIKKLERYKRTNKEYLLKITSGRICICELVQSIKSLNNGEQIENIFMAPNGSYKLILHQLNMEQLNDEDYLKTHVNEKEYTYYKYIDPTNPWGCLFFVIGFIAFLFKLWVIVAVVIIGYLIYLAAITIKKVKDVRYQKIKKSVQEFKTEHPMYIIELQSIQDEEIIEGGWYNLDFSEFIE